MANAITRITILHDPAKNALTATLPITEIALEPARMLQQLGKFFEGGAAGLNPCSVRVQHDTGGDKTLASQTIAITHANVTDGDTVTIGGVVFTWRNSPSGESEVLIGANATADGDNFVTKLNAHSKLVGLFTATNAAGTVTLKANFPGRQFNLITLATSDATAFALGAAVMAGGTGTNLVSMRQYDRGVVGT